MYAFTGFGWYFYDNFFIVLRVFYIFPYQFLKQANDRVDKQRAKYGLYKSNH